MARNALKASTSAPSQDKPLALPSTLALVLKDPVTLQGTPDPTKWEPPTFSILKETLTQGLAAIESQLTPGGPKAVADEIMALAMATMAPGTEGMSMAGMQGFLSAQLAVYTTHLGHIPRDALEAAAKAHIRRPSKFFPTVAELLEFAQPELERRQRFKLRIERLLRGEKTSTVVRPPILTPDERHAETIARMRGTVAAYRRLGMDARAEKVEAEMAMVEGHKSAMAAVVPVSARQPTAPAMATHDEPPMHDDIPE